MFFIIQKLFPQRVDHRLTWRVRSSEIAPCITVGYVVEELLKKRKILIFTSLPKLLVSREPKSTIKCYFSIHLRKFPFPGNTALHYAVELDDRDAITLLLDSGAHMGAQNSNGDLVVKFMRAETLEYLLDRSISSKGQLLDKDYQIIFDYSLLVSKEQRPEPVPVEETELLVALSEVVELRPMLKHPVLTSFLDLQWQNVTSGLYWRVFLIHAFLSFALTGFILMVYVPKMTIKHLQLHEGVCRNENFF